MISSFSHDTTKTSVIYLIHAFCKRPYQASRAHDSCWQILFLPGERNSWYAEHCIRNSLITFQNKLAFQRGAFWKQKFGNVFIIKLFCCLINANTTPAKAFISTHLKNLETQFSSQLKNLPNEEFQWVSNHLLEILKYSTLQLMCKNNKLMQGKIEIDDVDFNENFCIINV